MSWCCVVLTVIFSYPSRSMERYFPQSPTKPPPISTTSFQSSPNPRGDNPISSTSHASRTLKEQNAYVGVLESRLRVLEDENALLGRALLHIQEEEEAKRGQSGGGDESAQRVLRERLEAAEKQLERLQAKHEKGFCYTLFFSISLLSRIIAR